MQNSPSPDLKSVVEQACELLAVELEMHADRDTAAWVRGVRQPGDYAVISSACALRAIEKALLTQKDRLDKLEEALREVLDTHEREAKAQSKYERMQANRSAYDRCEVVAAGEAACEAMCAASEAERKARDALTGSHT